MRHVLAAAIAALSLSSAAAQANLITNPGFETSDLTGWSFTGPAPVGVISVEPHSGTYHWSGASIGGAGTLSQSVATTSGASYTLSFYLTNREHNWGTPNSWEVQWNGATVAGAADAATFAYTLFSYTVTGTGSDTVAFLLRHDPGAYFLDDVSLVAAPEVAAPEPASLALLGLAVAGLAAARRRRV